MSKENYIEPYIQFSLLPNFILANKYPEARTFLRMLKSDLKVKYHIEDEELETYIGRLLFLLDQENSNFYHIIKTISNVNYALAFGAKLQLTEVSDDD